MPKLRRIFASPLALAALACACGSLHAQQIYKGLDANGRVAYSDSPKSLRGAQRIDVQAPAASGSPPAVATLAENHNAEGSNPAQQPSAQDSRTKIIEAEELLAAAIVAQKNGAEPMEGERQGSATRANRLSGAYFARQEELAKDVERAKALVDEAYAAKRSAGITGR